MRRILILAPTFFPDPIVAAVRMSQWARHLPEFGWTPLVLCRHHGHTATQEELAERVHPVVQVEYLGPRVGAESREPRRGYPAGRWKVRVKQQLVKQVLGPLAVPDALVWKWKALRRQAIEIAQRWQPDVVLSSSPPHSIHWLGRELARAVDAAWVADFRDPYLIDSRYELHGLQRLLAGRHRDYERSIYRDADMCVHAIPLHGRWASRYCTLARDKVRILPNGVPAELLDEQFPGSAGEVPRQVGRVSIRAVGVLGRGAVALIAATLRSLVVEGIDAEFRHVGHARDASETIPPELRDRFWLLGPVSHEEALREIAGADVLLNHLDGERAKVLGLSSKLFEYLATGQPIIAINPTRSDRRLVGRLPWCYCLSDPQPTAVADALQEAIISGATPSERWLDTFRQRYNRRNQTQQLAGWLDELVAHRRCG